MKTYGKIKVIKSGDFYEGNIVEKMSESRKVVYRRYYIEFKERQVSDEIPINIVSVAQKKTPVLQMKEIAEQIGTNNFRIDEDVVEEIKKLAKEANI